VSPLKRAIDYEVSDGLKCFLAEFFILEFVESVERACEQSLALSRLLRAPDRPNRS